MIEEGGAVGGYRFTHALMQETLLGELSTPVASDCIGQIGEALEHAVRP